MIDIDECQENLHSCQHVCNNTDGSYSCGCNEGYMLDSDGQNCTGIMLLSSIIKIKFHYPLEFLAKLKIKYFVTSLSVVVTAFKDSIVY